MILSRCKYEYWTKIIIFDTNILFKVGILIVFGASSSVENVNIVADLIDKFDKVRGGFSKARELVLEMSLFILPQLPHFSRFCV